MHILVSDDRIVCIGPFNSEEEATTHLSQEMGYVPGAGYWELDNLSGGKEENRV